MRTAEKSANSIGKGLVAGFAGTAAMTISSTVEAKLRGRTPSTAPARATAKALGIATFEDAIVQARFNDLSHWGYGTGWGHRPRPARRGRPPCPQGHRGARCGRLG